MLEDDTVTVKTPLCRIVVVSERIASIRWIRLVAFFSDRVRSSKKLEHFRSWFALNKFELFQQASHKKKCKKLSKRPATTKHRTKTSRPTDQRVI
jgi:hypothetical protein